MMNLYKSKKAVAPIVLIGGALGVLLLIYLLLYIPIPEFTKIRVSTNYYIIVALWVILQIGIIYGAVKVIGYIKQGISLYKNKLLKLDLRIKDFILTH